MVVNAADSVRVITTVEGTGPATLGFSTEFARSFDDVATFDVRPVNAIPYRIDAVDGAAFVLGQCEQGIGTLLADGTFERTLPTWSRSLSGVVAGACDFVAGSKHLYVAASIDSVVALIDAATASSWTDLATRWQSPPTLAGTVAAGDVYAYVLDGVTRYRLVPSNYDATQDAFFATFSAGVLSGLICSRGTL